MHNKKVILLNTPRLEIFTKRIEENARSIIHLCHSHGVRVACVTKVIRAHPAVVQALARAGADLLADSRISNLQSISDTHVPLERMLLRAPAPGQVAQVVESTDVSLNSSYEILKRLSQSAGAQKKRHGVIIMVDVGDLREGVWPNRVPYMMKMVAGLLGLDVWGLGCNLACHAGVIPTVENMEMLVNARNICRKITGLDLPVLSGGNSANLPLLASGNLPGEINQLRIGEAILLGRNVIDRTPWPGTRQDTFRLVAEVLEMERKPSIPVGVRGQDAFGGFGEFIDRGIRRRAICNLGRQDVIIEGIIPEDPGVIVLGGSSDHLILDVEEASQPLEVGSEIGFTLNYGSLLAASTSEYVEKVVCAENC